MIWEIDGITWVLVLLPVVAFLYASVGHGGASGYLALMALFSFPVGMMKPTALLLNLFVAGISFYHYWRNGHFRWSLFYPFALTSVPFAFLGGYLGVEASTYRIILGGLLLFAVVRMLWKPKAEEGETLKPSFFYALFLGACIGFFSGLIGIGGGIILSPLILLFNWGKMKETAAVSALFIWVNSLAGIIGLLSGGSVIESSSLLLVGVALMGGFAGAYYGSKKWNHQMLRYLLAFVLILASFKLVLF